MRKMVVMPANSNPATWFLILCFLFVNKLKTVCICGISSHIPEVVECV